jgi:hypothetical protein
MTLEKSFEEISEADLLLLVEDKVSEKRTIEYKRDLPSEIYESKKEFLADVSSLANASGGHIIFGVHEENGLPIAMCGITCDDPDCEILRLENLIRDGIEPRLQGVLVRGIRLELGTYAFILRVSRSWSKPHVVNYKGHWRFYSRNSVGKYPLDTSEVRSAFLESGGLAEKIRHFRDNRLDSIISEQMPARLITGARTVLHLVPYAAFETRVSFSLDVIANNPSSLKPIYGSITNYRYNFDGFLTINGNESGESRGYVQIYRNGIIEAVDGSMLRKREDSPTIPSIVFERELIGAVRLYLDVQKKMTVPPPISILLSLMGVSGYNMAVKQGIDSWNEIRHPIDRDTLILPEIIFESFPSDIARALRPVFDMVWNATGFSLSLNYDDQGEWGKGPNC